MKNIYYIELVNGWYIIHGVIGTKKYLYYTKKECIKLYNQECKKQLLLEKGN